jgi:cytochrome c553
MRISYLLIVLCTLLPATSALAGKTAQQLIGACSRCHGEDGNASGQYPDLAGQQAEYTAKQLMDFKTGARKNSQMSPFVGVLSEEDMQTLGKYYSDSRSSVRELPSEELSWTRPDSQNLASESRLPCQPDEGFPGRKTHQRQRAEDHLHE